MVGKLTTVFSDSDILFLVETVNPRLVTRIDTVKSDPSIIEGMLDHEAGKLFQRIMLTGEENVMARITPRFLFEVLLRRTIRELESQHYTMERTTNQQIPVFDTGELVQFLRNKTVLRYLADMLSSFTKVEGFTLSIRIRKGIWRKIRYSDMDINSLAKLCEAMDEEHRFSLYKRIADLCLFILGMFPEYAPPDFRYFPGGDSRPQPLRRLERSAEDYEEEGRRFYKLAGEHENARILDLTEVFRQLHEKFNLARKPLNYISENYLQFQRQKLFPSLSPN